MLSQDRLAELIERADVQRRILGGYRGPFALGVTLDPDDRSRLAIRVRVEGGDAPEIAPHVELDGSRVPVVVSPMFRAPKPLPAEIGG